MVKEKVKVQCRRRGSDHHQTRLFYNGQPSHHSHFIVMLVVVKHLKKLPKTPNYSTIANYEGEAKTTEKGRSFFCKNNNFVQKA